MSILQEIQDSVSQVKTEVLGGADINQAVVKCTKGMTKEGTKRVIEEVNVANFLDVLKSGEDKSQKFPVADPTLIFKDIAKESLVKTDLIKDAEVASYDFYTNEKVAHAKFDLPPLPITGNSPVDVSSHGIDYILSQKNVLNKRAEMYRDIVDECDGIIIESMTKIATMVMNRPDKAVPMFMDMMKKHGPGAKRMIPFICKHANLREKDIDREISLVKGAGLRDATDYVYDSDTEPVRLTGCTLDAIDKRNRFSVMSDTEFSKIAQINDMIKKKAVAWDEPINPYEARQLAQQDTDLWERRETDRKLKETAAKKSDEASVDKAKLEKDKFEAQQMDSAVSRIRDTSAKVTGGMRNMSKGFAGGLKQVTDTLTRPTGLGEKIKGVVGSITNIRPDPAGLQEELEKEVEVGDKFDSVIKQKKVIESLMDDDEMLKEQDPALIANLYKTLTEIAPNVATKKEIVRSFLRQISSQAEPTLDPMYATQLMKLDKVMSGDTSIRLD